jgi:hypothetical protein
LDAIAGRGGLPVARTLASPATPVIIPARMTLRTDLARLRDGESFDVVVIGAGGAGLCAALFAELDGARVLLVEHTGLVGGTTALSAGTAWIPGTHHAAAVAGDDSLERAALYLDNAIGARSSSGMRRVLLEHGPDVVARLEADTAVRFRACPLHPDYLSELEGSTLKGRALEPLPFDGRALGPLFALLRPPIPEFTVLGGMMVDRNDIFHLVRITRAWSSLRYCLRLFARHAADRLRHPRGTRLVMGNALVARLLHSLAQRANARLLLCTAVESVDGGPHGVQSIRLACADVRRTVAVTGGLILAGGGFNRHPQLRASMLPGIDAAWCPGAPGHTGRMHDLVAPLGAHYGPAAASHAYWAPVSLRRRRDGSSAVFPHFLMDRAKPGMITVNAAGRRFVNESTSYHLFALAMQASHSVTSSVPAFMIADADALRRYGMGMVRPGARGLPSFLADGYLASAGTLDGLAALLGIDACGLRDSVARNNAYARSGIDADFQRGSTAYQRNLGDAAHGPNPSLGPIARPPYYAIRLYPGDIGAATGLVTDASARVLDVQDAPIGGLYAVGNDMHSVMGGVYTAPGITLGPALVFGSIAGRHAAARANAAGSMT